MVGVQYAQQTSSNNVLITDDDSDFLYTFEELVSDYDKTIKIEKVLKSEECLAISKITDFDVIFLDYDMPKMNGIQLFQQLRNNPETADVAIYFK
jgi:CheY-like chemotaxis protein